MCLLRDLEVDLLNPLRTGAGQEELRRLILSAIWDKPWGHGLADGVVSSGRVMSQIGG
jgi:cyclic pyranopterin phosphate synthase